MRILVYGYGNPGRQDDGLGAALVSMLEQAPIPGVDTECNYQLNIEDAYTISEYDAVVFVDASLVEEVPYSFKSIDPSLEITFTTHSMAPESVIALCEETGLHCPPSFLLAIRGYQWEFQEGLSDNARENLQKAYEFLTSLLYRDSVDFLFKASEGGPVPIDLQ
ncbi:MAG: hydrogenase maturation protease [Spirochaetes bacterium]|nr:hydrogenase maturation protease [Spirochaetota bacterium]